MTFDYINHLFGIPNDYLKQELAITDSRYPFFTIEQYIKITNGNTIAVIDSIKNKVKTYMDLQGQDKNNMSAFIFWLLAYLLLYKYITLFIVCYLAALLIPLPSNTSLLAASAFASQGYLNIYAVILVALIANILGDITGFLLARKFGKEFLMKIGFKKIILSKRYSSIELFIVKHSKITIFLTQFVGGVGPLVNIVTGFSKEIPLKKFLLYGVAGETLYVMTLSLGGYFVGSAWQEITGSAEFFSIVVICLVLLFIYRKFFSKKIKHAYSRLKRLPKTWINT